MCLYLTPTFLIDLVTRIPSNVSKFHTIRQIPKVVYKPHRACTCGNS